MSTHLGTQNFLDTPTVNSQPVLVTAGGLNTISMGSALPAASLAGRLFFNTSDNVVYRDTGSAWVRVSSPVIQMVTGTITSTSGNTTIPYDNTTPLISEGTQLWSLSFTPLRADSTIVVTTNSFYATATSTDCYTTGATFNGTALIGATLLGFTTNAGNGSVFTSIASHTSGSTTARTYSFRAGGNVSTTYYFSQGSGGQAYGSATNSGTYSIVEIAP